VIRTLFPIYSSIMSIPTYRLDILSEFISIGDSLGYRENRGNEGLTGSCRSKCGRLPDETRHGVEATDGTASQVGSDSARAKENAGPLVARHSASSADKAVRLPVFARSDSVVVPDGAEPRHHTGGDARRSTNNSYGLVCWVKTPPMSPLPSTSNMYPVVGELR